MSTTIGASVTRRRKLVVEILRLTNAGDGETAARLRGYVVLILLAELLAASERNDRRRPWMRSEPVARRWSGRRLARSSVTGRRPRG
jgi:hypothetical protein